jgi:AraC-like DNA-binding protein
VASEYREWPVAGADRVVVCRWEQRIDGQVRGYVQRVVPDGCADVIVIDDGRAVVVGPTAEASLPELAPNSTVVGLRMRTEAIRAVFGVPGYELRDRGVPLDAVVGPSLARCLFDALVEPEAVGDDWLRPWLVERGSRVDGRTAAAVGQLQGSGTVDVATVAETVGLSCRQLRRVVEAETGLGPKTVQRIGRLQRFLQLVDGAATLARAPAVGISGSPLAEWAVITGYADQAHLTKDITNLAGITPARLIAERVGGVSTN